MSIANASTINKVRLLRDRDENQCSLGGLDVVTGKADVIGFGEVVCLPRLLPGWSLQRMLLLVPTIEAAEKRVSPVNLTRSSPSEVQTVLIPVNITHWSIKQTHNVISFAKNLRTCFTAVLSW